MTDWRGGLYKARREIIRRLDNFMTLKVTLYGRYSTSIRDLTSRVREIHCTTSGGKRRGGNPLREKRRKKKCVERERGRTSFPYTRVYLHSSVISANASASRIVLDKPPDQTTREPINPHVLT